MMLKIKDDVDLKELEKFGFKPKYDEDTGKIIRYIYLKQIVRKTERTEKEYIEALEIKLINDIKDYGDFFRQREVSYWKLNQLEFNTLDVIYDLIKKVEEK